MPLSHLAKNTLIVVFASDAYKTKFFQMIIVLVSLQPLIVLSMITKETVSSAKPISSFPSTKKFATNRSRIVVNMQKMVFVFHVLTIKFFPKTDPDAIPISAPSQTAKFFPLTEIVKNAKPTLFSHRVEKNVTFPSNGAPHMQILDSVKFVMKSILFLITD